VSAGESFELVFSMGRHFFSEEAVARLVGQRPSVNGCPGEIVAAWRDGSGMVQVRVRAEGRNPLEGVEVPGFPVSPGYLWPGVPA
jgi:hypothetical protein